MPRAIIGGMGSGSGSTVGWAASPEVAITRRQLGETRRELNDTNRLLTVVDAGLSARHLALGDIAATGATVLAHRADPTDTLGDPDFMQVPVPLSRGTVGRNVLSLVQRLPEPAPAVPAEIFLG